MNTQIDFIPNMPLLLVEPKTGRGIVIKREGKASKTSNSTPRTGDVFVAGNLRFEADIITAEPHKRFKVKSDGKVKTSLNVLARAHQTYAFGKPERVINDGHLFNQLTERLNRQLKAYEYTQKLVPVRHVAKAHTVAPNVNKAVLQQVGDLFTALLLFKGVSYADVKRELILAKAEGKKSVTYNVNTTVTFGELQFKVHQITVKKTLESGLFFCSKSCRPAQMALQALKLVDIERLNNIE